MRSIALMNQKGGVGKTTTAVNLSAALANAGAKVCLVDLDPQAHATLHFGIAPQEEFASIYDVLVENKKLSDVRRKVAENLWLIPSHLDLSSADMQLASIPGRELILRSKFSTDDLQFDYILMDCPPSLSVLTLNALTAVEEVFIPLQPHYLALHGLIKLLQTIELVSERLNNKLKVSGVVFCMFDRQTRFAAEVAQEVETLFMREREKSLPWSNAEIFQTKIRRNIRLAEAPSHGQPIFVYDANSNGAEDYLALASEVHGQPIPEFGPAK